MLNTTRKLTAISILSGIGVIVSAIQSNQYYKLKGVGGFKSFCTFGENFNCDVINASRYAELVGGIPLSSFAGGWFLALILVSLFAQSTDWRRDAVRLGTWMTGFASVMSLIYLVIMVGALKTFCLLCLIVDALSITSFLLFLSIHRKHEPSALDIGKLKTLLLTTAGCLFVVIVLLKSFDQFSIKQSDIRDMVESVMSTSPVSVTVTEDQPSIGPKDAPFTLVKFSDFQCPSCRGGAMSAHAAMAQHPGKIRLVLRNYPWDPSCNPKVHRSMHPNACEAAKVAWCSHQQGKFAEVYEAIFEHQADLKPGLPAQLAEKAGVDPTKLAECVKSDAVAQAIQRDLEEGARLGVQATPTFFLNGRKIEGSLPPKVWGEVIERLGAQPK